MKSPLLIAEGFFGGAVLEFIILSDDFYGRYSSCPEILQKRDRPYCCLPVVIKGVTYAIPLRHHISHSHCYHTVGDAGLDYSKAVVIADPSDIRQSGVQINSAEFQVIRKNISHIRTGMTNYIKDYKNALRFSTEPHYANFLRYSSLQYFHKYLK